METMNGFARGGKDFTPIHDKNSVLASKPQIGGKMRHQLIRSPDKSFQYGGVPNEFNSEMRNHMTNHQKEIEEEIGALEDTYEDD